MVDNAAILLVFLAYMAFATKRGMTFLHIFQQEEYDGSRFLRWMMRNRVFDTRLSLWLVLTGLAWFFGPPFLALFMTFIGFTIVAFIEKDPRQDSKKKLVMTQRARRVFFLTLAMSALLSTWFFLVPLPWIWIFNVQVIPVLLVLANTILEPFENAVQKKLWTEANDKLRVLKPTVIGVTGSFGKTSVKHILGHILKSHAPTLVTPGSINTPMGITRIIREQLEEHHKYFVVEMGAYAPGSIERLCRLAPPDMGIVTSIGHAHYERFKSLETVADAKYELAQAVLRKGGNMIVHEQTLRFDSTSKMRLNHADHFVVCGPDNSYEPGSHGVKIIEINQETSGLDIVVGWEGETYLLQVPLYGLHHGQNVALAFGAAVTLGIPPKNVITALKSVPQITHRLEVKKIDGGVTLIDDAFNSNPIGFQSALELLSVIKKDGRNILITPGMVELGHAHDEAHEKMGQYAGRVCDVAIVIQGKRIPSFINGYKSTANGKPLVEVRTFEEASKWLDQNKKSGDIVLIENDLPDSYERIPRI